MMAFLSVKWRVIGTQNSGAPIGGFLFLITNSMTKQLGFNFI